MDLEIINIWKKENPKIIIFATLLIGSLEYSVLQRPNSVRVTHCRCSLLASGPDPCLSSVQ